MDLYDTTNVLFSKIKSLDPENASRILGYILIQDLAEGNLLRLAFGPETLLQSLVLKAKTSLGFSSNTFPTPLNPISRLNSTNCNNSQNSFSLSSPRLIPRNGFLGFSNKVPSMSPTSGPKSSPFLSNENIRSGSSSVPLRTGVNDSALIDENQMSEYLSFMNDSSSSRNEEFVGHRRSYSESDACFGTAEEAGGFDGLVGGYKPCLYFSRGFFKNGDNCKFTHAVCLADNVDVNGFVVGSASKMDLLYHQNEEMMRMREAAQQKRLAASQLMAGVSSPLPYEKGMDLLLQQKNDAHRAAALMLSEEVCKFAHGRSEKNDFWAMRLSELANSASKQIYLTFPADSGFKDEDVSKYFSMFGPVQDVRIPYQQKRMFGFVTFVHPETVKLILARGNPHFICESRVLVKPYKEKRKLPDKRQHLNQQFERGNFSPCSSLSGLDPREPSDHLGAKMFYNASEMMLRREQEEQADLQQAIELQRRRFVNLKLPVPKNDGIHHNQRSLSADASVFFPAYSHTTQHVHPSYSIKQEISEVNGDTADVAVSSTMVVAEQEEVNSACVQKGGDGNAVECSNTKVYREGNVDHALPDSPFASPKKSTENHLSERSALTEVNESPALGATQTSANDQSLPIASTTDMASI